MKKLIYISFCIFLFACKKENNCFIPAGKESSKIIELGNFNSIHVNRFLNVDWVKSSTYKMEIIGGKNFIDNISGDIAENCLILKNNNGCQVLRENVKDVKVIIHAPLLDSIEMLGNGKITFLDTLKSDIVIRSIANQGSLDLLIKNNFIRFYIESGSTDFTIKGTNRYCDYYNASFAHFYGKDFIIDSLSLNNRGNGVTQVHCARWMQLLQDGDGELEYWGNPDTIEVKSYKGKGQLIKRD